jgi:hypothetical protein
MRLRKDSRQKSENNLAGAKSFNAKNRPASVDVLHRREKYLIDLVPVPSYRAKLRRNFSKKN